MLFLALMSITNFLDWFESGGFFLVIGLPIVVAAVAVGSYEAGKQNGSREK